MIKIECKTLSVCFEDTICLSSVEIFPDFTTKTFKDGFSVFGADGQSFYIPNNTTYTINDTPKSFEEVVSELPLCLSGIEGKNEVQCFADLASFPTVGEECVVYIDEATNLTYHWDGSNYVQLSAAGNLYESIVAADGSGDYLLLSEALNAGETSIWQKNGTYIETESPTVTNDYTSITGESIGGVKNILTGGFSIKTAAITPYKIGTIAIVNDTKIVTLTGGTFPAGSVGMRIRLNQEYYQVLTRNSNTQVTLKYKYKGRTFTGNSYSITDIYAGIQIQNMSIIGENGATINTAPLVLFNNIYNGYAENLFISTTEEDCFVLDDCANFAINKCVAWNAGADTVNQKSGFLITSDNVKITTCSGSNCNFAGLSLSGESITVENSDLNNNDRYGIYIPSPAEGQYIIDSCTCDSNNLNGISVGTGVNNVSITNCTISNTTSAGASGVQLKGEGNTVTGNLFLNNAGGIKVTNDSTITSNVFRNNFANVIHIEGVNVTVTGNTVDGGTNGFYVKNSSNCLISKNRISNCSDGIEMFGIGSDNRFEMNDINNNTLGILIAVGFANTNFTHNTLYSNGTDIVDNSTTTQTIDDSAEALFRTKSTTKGIVLIPMTAVQASAITPVEGLLLFVSDTDATFLSVGYWAYESGTWNKL